MHAHSTCRWSTVITTQLKTKNKKTLTTAKWLMFPILDKVISYPYLSSVKEVRITRVSSKD